jgi:adenylate cyclase
MALFGLSGEVEEAAANAVRAALDMVDALRAMNLRQKVLGGRALRIGIGIDAGVAVVGFMGSHLRQSYTAIGDVVNTASRLEGKTKDFPGCEIVISQAVEEIQQHQRVAETTYLGSLELKGKTQTVNVYQVRGPRAATSAPR